MVIKDIKHNRRESSEHKDVRKQKINYFVVILLCSMSENPLYLMGCSVFMDG